MTGVSTKADVESAMRALFGGGARVRFENDAEMIIVETPLLEYRSARRLQPAAARWLLENMPIAVPWRLSVETSLRVPLTGIDVIFGRVMGPNDARAQSVSG